MQTGSNPTSTLPTHMQNQGEKVEFSDQKSLISIIIPCYNEGTGIGEFYRVLREVCNDHPKYYYEFVFVNDGSHDCVTPQRL